MAKDDTNLHQYQDDLDTRDDITDPVMDEEGDDPTEDLQIPPDELRDELEKIDLTETDDDMREMIEDRGEDQNLKDRW